MSADRMPEVVVVTGASAGVGRAVVRMLARPGIRIALLARSPDGLAGARREVEAAGGVALEIPTDAGDDRQVEAAAERTEREFGPIDVWINNAMVSVFSPVIEMTAAEYRRVTDVTYLGYVYGTLAALKRMTRRDRGVIVQVGSALSYRAIPLQSAYCAAKHAVQGFTESLRTELMHEGSRIRVTMVHLPAVNTPQFDWVKSRLPNKAQPVPPIYQPEVVAEAIVHAALHDVGRELFVGWPTLKAVYGNRIAPGYLDRRLAKAGFESQQTDEPADPGRPHNLWEPLPGDHGAHGAFDGRAREGSIQLWLSMHRELLAVATAGVVGVALGALTPTQRRSNGENGKRLSGARPQTGAASGSPAVQRVEIATERPWEKQPPTS